jgi:predicted kinase
MTEFSPPTLYIPIAIPGAGKTTWTRRVLDANWVSSDNIRERMWPGEPYDMTRNPEVFERYYGDIDLFLPYWNIIADATNLGAFARVKLYEIAQKHNAPVHVLLFTNVEQALARNAARAGNAQGDYCVPEDVMLKKMIPRYEQTLSVIDSEPYTYITRIESVA